MYIKTPALSALSKLINLYYLFKIGLDAGTAHGLEEYALTDEELAALQSLIMEEKKN